MARLLGSLLFIVMTLTSCSEQNEGVPGVTADTIRLGMIADQTGPLAFIGQQWSSGARLYLRHVNEQGGVHGRRIELIVEDDGYQPPRTVAAARKLLDRDRVFAFVGNLGTPTTLATESILEGERVPLIPAGTWSSVVYNPPRRYIFGFDPSYRMESWIMLDIIREESGASEPRIGVIYQDDDLGRDGLNGLHDAAQYYGMDVVAEEAYKRGAVDFSTQVFNLKQANVTHVVLWTVYREAAAVLKEAQQLGWTPDFYGGLPMADDKTVELAGQAAVNLKALSPVNLAADTENMKVYRNLVDRYDSGLRPSLYHAGGFLVAQIMVEGLSRAGRDLTRESLIEAVESFRGWDENFAKMPLAYGPGQRGGSMGQVYLLRANMEQKRFDYPDEPIRFEVPADRAASGDS